MNRVADERFPDDVCSVVTQNRRPGTLHSCQFSFYCNGQKEIVTDQDSWDIAYTIAQKVFENKLSLGVMATHYHATNVEPWWASEYEPLGTIGRHTFYLAGELE
jgi:spore germination cell wall hydrolase CwlJ-like protein